MKTRLMLIVSILLLVFSVSSFSQYSRGTVKEGLKIESKILGKTVRFTVYLPFDYYLSDRYYPVVYLLHGYTNSDMGWVQYGEANMIADKGISEGDFPPMIIVMPDGGVSWYINNFDNSVKYEDFFTKEFIPHIESKFRVRTEKRFRGVAGLSMGGYGTLIYALKHPDMFAACAPLSAAVYTDEEIMTQSEERWTKVASILFGPGLKGKERITEHYNSNSPLYLIKNGNAEKLKSVRYYIDCGDDDFLYKGNAALHVLLRDMNIPHEFRVRDGGHQWTY
ncbi:MAG: alpha/beta hydrolase, partial [Syntrophothermus sp.]